MPWLPQDAPRHDRKADMAHICRLWTEVANSVLAETGNEGRAAIPLHAGDFVDRSV